MTSVEAVRDVVIDGWHPATKAELSPLPCEGGRTPAAERWFRRYRRALIAVDAVMISSAIGLTLTLKFGDSTDPTVPGTGVSYLVAAGLIAVLWLMVLTARDSRERRVVGAGLEEYTRVINASLWTFGTVAIVSYLAEAQVSRLLFVATLPMGLVLLTFGRWVSRTVLNRLRLTGEAMTATLVVGTTDDVRRLARDMTQRRDAGYRVAAVCEYGSAGAASEDGSYLSGLPHVSLREIGSYVRRTGIGAVAVSGALPADELRRLAWSLEDSPTQLMFTPRLLDVSGPRMKMSDVQGLSLVHVDLPRFTGWHHVLKRVVDVLLSAVALVVLSPLLAVIALAVKMDDRGPIWFRQERIGMGGRPFIIHKFRSMSEDAESRIDEMIKATGCPALWFKLEDDPRITRVGRVIRKYSLDELPQFWTVLRGGMSIVGPRPQVAREVAEYDDDLHRRLLVKPGITGLWQVNGRSSLSLEESVRLDLHYVENWSLTSDLAVILKTIKVVIRYQGAH